MGDTLALDVVTGDPTGTHPLFVPVFTPFPKGSFATVGGVPADPRPSRSRCGLPYRTSLVTGRDPD